MKYLRDKGRVFFQMISLPIIWSVLISLVIFDIWIEIYHRICFPLYRIKYVRRWDYVKVDRYKLQYLRWYEKIGFYFATVQLEVKCEDEGAEEIESGS